MHGSLHAPLYRNICIEIENIRIWDITQAHQWVQQALPSLEKLDTIYPQMKRLLETAKEKDQFMGPDMERIVDLSIQEKMSTLSSITALTINIQKVLQSWI